MMRRKSFSELVGNDELREMQEKDEVKELFEGFFIVNSAMKSICLVNSKP